MTVEAQIAAYEQRLRELVPGATAGRRELLCEGGCGTLMRTYIDHPMCQPCRREKPKSKPERTDKQREADRAAGRAKYAAGYRSPASSRLCAGPCGKLLGWSPKRGSRNNPMCQECRRLARQRICEQCGKQFEAKTADRPQNPNKFCSIKCRGAARRKYDDPKASRRAYTRQRKANRALTGDGVTDEAIAARDNWTCQLCHQPIDRWRSRKTDPWGLVIDHVIQLCYSGNDTALNKRAAHARCNNIRGSRLDPADLAGFSTEDLRAMTSGGPLPVVVDQRPRHPWHKPVDLPWPTVKFWWTSVRPGW